jgi:hypothetical protein
VSAVSPRSSPRYLGTQAILIGKHRLRSFQGTSPQPRVLHRRSPRSIQRRFRQTLVCTISPRRLEARRREGVATQEDGSGPSVRGPYGFMSAYHKGCREKDRDRARDASLCCSDEEEEVRFLLWARHPKYSEMKPIGRHGTRPSFLAPFLCLIDGLVFFFVTAGGQIERHCWSER